MQPLEYRSGCCATWCFQSSTRPIQSGRITSARAKDAVTPRTQVQGHENHTIWTVAHGRAIQRHHTLPSHRSGCNNPSLEIPAGLKSC